VHVDVRIADNDLRGQSYLLGACRDYQWDILLDPQGLPQDQQEH